jgi:hypothetical protein
MKRAYQKTPQHPICPNSKYGLKFSLPSRHVNVESEKDRNLALFLPVSGKNEANEGKGLKTSDSAPPKS